MATTLLGYPVEKLTAEEAKVILLNDLHFMTHGEKGEKAKPGEIAMIITRLFLENNLKKD